MILTGNGAAPGVVLGSVHVYKKNNLKTKETFVSAGEEQAHLNHYNVVKKQAMDDLDKIRLVMEKQNPEKAKIFEAHKDIVDDIDINEEIPNKILKEKWAGDWAIYHVYEIFLNTVRKLPDPLLAERAIDIEDVRSRLLKLWHGQKEAGLSALNTPVIIAAKELLPSDTAALDKNMVLAILAETGGVTSHSAIIAKSYGIPAILGIKNLLNTVKHGQFAAVDAGEGTVILDPDNTIVEKYTKKCSEFLSKKNADLDYLYKEAITADKIKIDIGLNISSASDDELAAAAYTDSAGLFRTEFLYMGRDSLPSEDEQLTCYRKILECYGERPVILRTLDIGGDKLLSGMENNQEENPILGNRALRFCFSNPGIFRTQLRACLRASVYGNLWLMLPMISSIEDIRKAKEFIASVREELEAEGVTCAQIKTGIMIEIPSIAVIADIAAKEVDFASIGSNDLCQYLCAADRMNSAVEPYYQSYHPAMFKIIKETIRAFEKAGKPISMCGEMASDPLAVPALIGMGLRKLSMGAASVAAVKHAAASVTAKGAQELAAEVLECATAAEVEQKLAAQR